MNNRAKFEQMLELLVNENREQAEELFHELVVAKSKEIYESMLADEFEEEEEEGEDKPFGGDETDDYLDDVTSDDEEEGEDEEEDEFDSEEDEDDEVTKDDILDIKDALADLKAEFERMMGGEHEEETEESWEPEDEDSRDSHGTEPHDFEDEDEYEESYFNESAEMIKVGDVKHGEHGVNAKSTVARPNPMGGTTDNIAKAGKTETKGTRGGLVDPSAKEEDFGNVNNANKLSNKAPKMKPVGKNWDSAKTSAEQNVNDTSIIRGRK